VSALSYPFFGAVSLLVCACVLPLVKRVAVRFGLYDQPGDLKIHRAPVARIGGVAMMAGIVAAFALSGMQSWQEYSVCFAAIVAVWLCGLMDDLKSLSVVVRLFVQSAAGALLWIAGWRLNWSAHASLDLVLTVGFVMFLINAMNWLDGMDGLAAATAVVAAVGFILLPAGAFSTVLAWALVGACVGMLLVNFPPATVFMGDSGSMLIGIAFAIMSLEWVRSDPGSHNIVSPLCFIAVPIADALFAILRRLRSRRSPFLGDRRHFYDLLLQRGFSAREIVLTSVLCTGGLVVLGRLTHEGDSVLRVVVVGAGMFLLLAAYHLGSLRPDPARGDAQKQTPTNSIGMVPRRLTHS
jgi:UDP-GlcNAc:undecaprenyl-phosphate/decaprenyl-phosphate GlcNAc-1-phosphate transferase